MYFSPVKKKLGADVGKNLKNKEKEPSETPYL